MLIQRIDISGNSTRFLAWSAGLFLTFLFFVATVTTPAQTPPRGYLLVVTKQSHALAIIDASSLQVVGRVPIGEDPHEVVVGPDGRTAYISNYGEATLHTLAVVDLIDQKPLPPIDITPLSGAHGLWLHDQTLWLTAEGSKALGTIDLAAPNLAVRAPATSRIASVLGTGQDKTHLVWVSRDGQKVLASNAGSGTLSIFDRTINHPTTVVGAPPLPASYTAPTWRQTLVPDGIGAEGFDVSPDEREAWAGDDAGNITVIDLIAERADTTFTLDTRGANRIKFTPDGSLVLLTTHTGKDLLVFDARTRKLVKRIAIEERGASGIQIEPNGHRAFIACPRDHYVAVVDLTRLEMTGKIDAGREPDGLAWWLH
jgi:DNA-binding beta-propeller fold protein YncE